MAFFSHTPQGKIKMTEIDIRGDGLSTISMADDGSPIVKSDHPLEVYPSLPVTDVRVNLLELASITLSWEGTKRIVRGSYADGGSFEVSVDTEAGKFQTTGKEVISQIQNGDDQSHTVLTYLPRVRHVKKATH
jgi:hypothetical protein